MPEKQPPKPLAKRTKTTTQPPKEKPECHIHDKVESWEVEDIRKNVCVIDEDFTEHEGKFYCLFHLPKEKNIEKFNRIFLQRLENVEKEIKRVETELPEDEQEKAKREISYDFQYVWFLSEVDLSNYEFTSSADFSSATFTSSADFILAKFLDKSQTFFYQTSFQGVVYFGQAVVKGYLYFEAGRGEFFDGEWFDEAKTKPKMVERRTNVFENRLYFAHVRAEKPERITFNKVRLCAGWFVNIDSRKFVFTDIDWENHRAGKAELKKELNDLLERGFDEPHNFQLLTIAFRNLAANAEEFNRFEEASNFRKSASECERLERLNRRKNWWRDLGELWGKHILFRDLFTETKKSLAESSLKLEKAPFDFVHFLYRWLSGYGEKWFRAFLWLLVIWLGFAFLYYFVQGFEGNAEIGFYDSLGYSLQVMTLQRPEPRPSGFTRVIYGFETILAPLQAALLALAIRRKFMR